MPSIHTLTIQLKPQTVLTLDKYQIVIGRHTECDIVIENREISRNHAFMVQESDCVDCAIRYRLVDGSPPVGNHANRSSRNGTFINGKRIVTQLLKSGDVIHFGAVKCLYEIKENPTESGKETYSDSHSGELPTFGKLN